MATKKKPLVKKTSQKSAKKDQKKELLKKPISKPSVKLVVKPFSKSKEELKSGKRTLQLLRGMKDILPKDQYYWRAVARKAEQIADQFGFGRIETPVLEEAALFLRGVGKTTDIVEKEMYSFEDRDMEKVALRPEGTAGIVRAYIQHGMWNMPQPVKLSYWEQMFRHDRPQAGRYRQHTQAGFEIIGDASSVADAEIIIVAHTMYTELGVPVQIRINSVGMPDDRMRYKMELTQYYRSVRPQLCENCKARLLKNPLRLLDCKEEQCQPLKVKAPQILDFLSQDSRDHFMKVLEYLDELNIPYILDHTLVRGLDYYTKTVFEVWPQTNEQTAQSSLCGGGRYDLLVEELGGRPTPACGVGVGVERLISQMRERGAAVQIPSQPQVYVAQLGDQGKRKAFVLFMRLREAGIPADQDFSKNSLKAQLESANAKHIPYTLLIGQKEVQEGTVIIRDMDSGIQETVDFNKTVSIIKRKLGV